jgi:hypothetical protein
VSSAVHKPFNAGANKAFAREEHPDSAGEDSVRVQS